MRKLLLSALLFLPSYSFADRLGGIKSGTEVLLSTQASTVGVINTSTNPIDWSKLKNVPAGFADGTDDGSSGGSNVSARVRTSTAPAIPATTGATHTLQFTIEDNDTDTIHDTVTNTSRLTANTSGHYSIFGTVYTSTPSTVPYGREAFITVNGSTIIASDRVTHMNVLVADDISNLVMNPITQIDLLQNDYVELHVKTWRAESFIVSTGAVFGMSLMTGGGAGGGGLPLTPGDTNYIQVKNSLQNGSTFYVNQGNIDGKLILGNQGVEIYSDVADPYETPLVFKSPIPNLGSDATFKFTNAEPGVATETHLALEAGSSTGTLTWNAAVWYFSQDLEVPDEAYGSGWDGSTEVPTKNALYDKIETISGGGGGGSSSLAVGTGTASNFTTNITSPTAAESFLGSQFNVLANGTTSFVSLNLSSVTVEGKLIAGSNITLTPGAGSLTIAASASGGVTVYPATSPITVMLDSNSDGINSPAISLRNMHNGTFNGAGLIVYTATNTRVGAITFDVSTDAGYGDIGFYGMAGQGKLARIFSDGSTAQSLEFAGSGDSNIFMRNSGQGRMSWTNSASLFNFHGNVNVDNALSVAGVDVCLEDGTNCPASGVTGSTVPITFGFSGGGSAISAGVETSTACVPVTHDVIISSWTVIAPPPSVSGSISVTIRKASFANFPTFSAMSAGGNAPSLSSSVKNAATPASWTSTSLSAGDTVCAEVTSATTVTRAVVTLWGIR